MKRINTTKLLVLLLSLCLITSSFVGGTLAKYVTTGEATDSARVAKWGVTVTANGTTFANNYNDTVVGQGEAKVVAPGTEGKMVSMTLAGKPEVKTKVSYKADVVLSGWAVPGDDFYCPLIVSVHGTEVYGTAFDSAAAFAAQIENMIALHSMEYNQGTDLSTTANDSLAITWRWPFTTSAENDVKDTALGNAANNGNASTISLTVTTTVEQVD